MAAPTQPISERWKTAAHRIAGDKLSIANEPWRDVLTAGSTVGSPQLDAVYGANFSDALAGQSLRYKKTLGGVVWLVGSVARTAGIALGQTILTMPTGYRPAISLQGFSCAAHNAGSSTNIGLYATGIIDVRGFLTALQSETRTYISISYLAEES